MSVRGLSKTFAGTHALRDFEFELKAGEVHALVGGNGSGKSTFIKILAGVYGADAGDLETPDGRFDLAEQTPERARRLGLRFVHQDLGIFPLLSLADNLAIGRGFQTGVGGQISWRRTRAETRRVLDRFGIAGAPDTPAEELSIPQRAMLAIARALQDIAEDAGGILVLDEPTASLPPEEANLLISSIRGLAEQGHSVIIVTHRLDEVRRAADTVTALRDGRYIGTADAVRMSEGDLVELILGRRLSRSAQVGKPAVDAEPILRLSGVAGGPIAGVDLEVRPGEVVGIAGLLDSGRTELLELIYGARALAAGEVEFAGTTLRRPKPRRMRQMGMAFVPEDRQAAGIFPEHSVSENMIAGNLRPYFRGLRLRDRRIRRDVDADVARYAVKASSSAALIDTLSGGNQQKVVIGRWLRENPKLLLLDEPDQGIDVGARQEIFALLAGATTAGAGVLLVSSEFEELARLCTRVLVLGHGRIVAEHPHGIDSHELLESVLAHARSPK